MGEAVALLGVSHIQKKRSEVSGSKQTTAPRRAYLLNSLKHPKEVEMMQRIYAKSFFLISAYLSRDDRKKRLADTFAGANSDHTTELYYPQAEALMNRDELEADDEFGQNVRGTFPKGDLFVHTNDNVRLQASINRFVKLLFGYQFTTPTKDEYSMFVARAVAARSSAFGRQVGAVITTKDGDVIAVGTNEVPKGGGGLYWEDDAFVRDGRDFAKLGGDPNDDKKRKMVAEMFKRLGQKGWLNPEYAKRSPGDMADESLKDVLKGTEIIDLVAYDRTVHAEMAAITDAASRTIPIDRCTIYATTFPCHNCAKHIIASGITRCVYIEPYPKSRAYELHDDAIIHDQPVQEGKTAFDSFIGIAPRIYLEYFTALERKDGAGKMLTWTPAASKLRYVTSEVSYLAEEDANLKEFDKRYKVIQQ